MSYHWDFAKLLIDKGADVNAWDFWGESPLFVAVDLKSPQKSGRIDLPEDSATTGADIVERLLKAGANPNVQLKLRPPCRQPVSDRIQAPIFTTGATPLIRAARGTDLPSMRLLLAQGALVEPPNINGVTPLLAAAGATPRPGRHRGPRGHRAGDHRGRPPSEGGRGRCERRHA